MRVPRKQRRSGHDLARLAVPALHDIEVEPGLLDSGGRRCRAEGLDGRDLGLADADDRGDTRTGGVAVDMHRAGTAQRHAAAELGAGHAEHVAQHPQERGVAVDVDRPVDAIDPNRGGHRDLLVSRVDRACERQRSGLSQRGSKIRLGYPARRAGPLTENAIHWGFASSMNTKSCAARRDGIHRSRWPLRSCRRLTKLALRSIRAQAFALARLMRDEDRYRRRYGPQYIKGLYRGRSQPAMRVVRRLPMRQQQVTNGRDLRKLLQWADEPIGLPFILSGHRLERQWIEFRKCRVDLSEQRFDLVGARRNIAGDCRFTKDRTTDWFPCGGQAPFADVARPEPSIVGGLHHRLMRSEEHTSELQSLRHLVCRL